MLVYENQKKYFKSLCVKAIRYADAEDTEGLTFAFYIRVDALSVYSSSPFLAISKSRRDGVCLGAGPA